MQEEGDEEWKKCFIYLGVNKRKQPLFGWSPEPARSITLNEPVEQWMSKVQTLPDAAT